MKGRTRRERRIKDFVKRAGIAVFLIVFLASVVGVAVIAVVR